MTMVMFCAIGALLFMAIYWIGLQVRRLVAWVKKSDPPKERVGAMLVVMALVGVFGGWLAVEPVGQGWACYEAGEQIVPCIMANGPEP